MYIEKSDHLTELFQDDNNVLPMQLPLPPLFSTHIAAHYLCMTRYVSEAHNPRDRASQSGTVSFCAGVSSRHRKQEVSLVKGLSIPQTYKNLR